MTLKFLARIAWHWATPWRCKPSYIGKAMHDRPFTPYYIYVCPGCGRRLKESS